MWDDDLVVASTKTVSCTSFVEQHNAATEAACVLGIVWAAGQIRSL